MNATLSNDVYKILRLYLMTLFCNTLSLTLFFKITFACRNFYCLKIHLNLLQLLGLYAKCLTKTHYYNMNQSELDHTESSLFPASFQCPLYVSSHNVTRLSPCPQRPSSTSPTRLSPTLQNLSSSPSSSSPACFSPSLVLINSSSPSRLSPSPQPVSSSSSPMCTSPCPSPLSSSSPAIRLSPCPQPLHSSPTRLSPCPQLLTSHSPTRLSPCSIPLSPPVILKRPIHISSFSYSGNPLDPSTHTFPCSRYLFQNVMHLLSLKWPLKFQELMGIIVVHIAVFLHSKAASVTDSLEYSKQSLPSSQPSVQTTVQSDTEQSRLAITSCSERTAKSIPISKTRIQQKQRQEQFPRYQNQGMLHKDVSSEDKSIRDIVTKKESTSRQNLKHIGRGPQSLAFYKRKHLTQNPVLIQARLGLNKTGKTENPGSTLLFDKAKLKLNQALLKMQNNKDVSGAEMSQSKPHMAKSEAGDQTSGLTNRLQSNPRPDSQFKPSSEEEEFVSPKQSKIVASSSSSKAPHCDPDIHTCPITGVSQKIKSEGPPDIHENSNSSLLDLNTSVTENHKSTHHSKPRFTASETDTCISSLSQTKQMDYFRFPLKSHGSSVESSHLSRICRPESEPTTSNYIYTPRQLNQTDQFPLKSRTCRRVIKGAGSFSDRKSTYLISTQARKKDSSTQETGRRGSQKKDISKLSQKNHHGSDTDSSKSNSSQTSSQEAHLRKHKRLEVQIKCGISCSKHPTSTHTARDTRDDAVIPMASHDLPQTGSQRDLYNHPDQQTHTAIPELSMVDWMPQSGANKACEQSLTEEDSLTVEQVNFVQLHQQDDSLLRKPSVTEARKSKQEIIPLLGICAFTREYKPYDL